jgi:exodeoxyribonuclease V alpha subunit
LNITPLEKTNALPRQLSESIAHICKIESNPLLEKSISLLISALDEGSIRISMLTNLSASKEKSVASWQKKLIETGAASKAPGYAPLIIDGDQLYLARYYHYQSQLKHILIELGNTAVPEIGHKKATKIIANLFPEGETQPSWQKVAAVLALKKSLCVISGGPGTGKTTTMLRVLATLCEVSPHQLRIRLAAPTGKAAMRMQESIRDNLTKLNCSDDIKQQLSVDACTLHRLLGYRPHSVKFRHNTNHPLALDVLVVDESSMVDSAMMAKLLSAIPKGAKVILLGDKDQLEAVAPGSPFTEICQQAGFSQSFAKELSEMADVDFSYFSGDESIISAEPQPLADNIIFLRHSYRFDSKSGIGQLANAVNQGQFKESIALMKGDQHSDINWVDYQPSDYRGYNKPDTDPLVKRVQQGFKSYLEALKEDDLTTIFNAFSHFCLLAAARQGYSGVEDTNALAQSALGFPNDTKWYHGRPVMVTRNDYQVALFNGDVGICLDLNKEGLRVYFPSMHEYRDFTPSRVPQHETAFAMTIHKSQGSEFEEVLIILPESNSRVLEKSLLYTGITRAKKHVTLWGKKETLMA